MPIFFVYWLILLSLVVFGYLNQYYNFGFPKWYSIWSPLFFYLMIVGYKVIDGYTQYQRDIAKLNEKERQDLANITVEFANKLGAASLNGSQYWQVKNSIKIKIIEEKNERKRRFKKALIKYLYFLKDS